MKDAFFSVTLGSFLGYAAWIFSYCWTTCRYVWWSLSLFPGSLSRQCLWNQYWNQGICWSGVRHMVGHMMPSGLKKWLITVGWLGYELASEIWWEAGSESWGGNVEATCPFLAKNDAYDQSVWKAVGYSLAFFWVEALVEKVKGCKLYPSDFSEYSFSLGCPFYWVERSSLPVLSIFLSLYGLFFPFTCVNYVSFHLFPHFDTVRFYVLGSFGSWLNLVVV